MADKRTAILDATRELLAEGGVHGLTVEGVAARAGVAKTTIYRRWRSKDELAFAVLIDMVEQFVATPDLDDTRDELVAFVAAAVRILGTTLMGRVMQGLVSDLAADPELARRLPRGGRRHARRRGAPPRRARDRARRPAPRHRSRSSSTSCCSGRSTTASCSAARRSTRASPSASSTPCCPRSPPSRSGRRPSAQRDPGVHARAAPGRAADLEAPVHGADAVGQAAQARPGGRVGAADAVVADLDLEPRRRRGGRPPPRATRGCTCRRW